MPSSEQRQFIPRIESMRGIAALTVALMHVSNSWTDFPFAQLPGRNLLDRLGLFTIHAFANGYGAVVAFFVISGFVLARSLDRKFNIPRFVLARIFRLYPAVIVTVAIFAALFYGSGFSLYPKASFEPLNVLANMLILRADIDVVMWSLKAEVAATPLIILCVWLFRRYGRWPVIAIAVALFALSFVGQYRHMIGDDTDLAPLYAFPIGILVHFKGRELADALPRLAVVLCAGASVAVFCGSSLVKPTGTWVMLAESLSAATLVMLIAYRSDVLVFKALDHDVVRFYGQISYSFYLLHPLSIWWINRLTLLLHEQVETMPVSLLMALMYIFSLIAITPLAWLCWRFVELSAMNRLRAPPASRYGPTMAASGDGRAS